MLNTFRLSDVFSGAVHPLSTLILACFICFVGNFKLLFNAGHLQKNAGQGISRRVKNDLLMQRLRDL